ncbi:NAD-dependent epimerase/dehydratase family protein [Jeotgalibacillus salarius]|uniref:SDR family oxidoreductase n=1 Tax=Jeotgalibacillus salarius TaxID=546023 RepID=A0A4Y8LG04_9BACL|nr:NAD-dependent epimerase/dehydratase family protein [Jeotgalibacillus salarius]TFE01702.1 SDR family oxidoreductase [Jeotgalibacillus salarius]
MKVLITGSNGFIAQNLMAELQQHPDCELFLFNRNTPEDLFDQYCRDADFVFHLAGVNRPLHTSEFEAGNKGLTEELVTRLEKHHNQCPVVYSSSIQAEQKNPYGLSKQKGEEVLQVHAALQQSKVFIYRLPNVFGKWSRPDYNSVVATFCYRISRGQSITLHDPSTTLMLVYIDDVVKSFVHLMRHHLSVESGYREIVPVYHTELGRIAETIDSFRKCREELSLPDMSKELIKKLYSTYLSYLPTDNFSYSLTMHRDHRGSFSEFLKTSERGQVSVNISKPGIVKGNHWHHSKNEKFLVVSGRGVIRFRHILSKEVIEYFVSGDELQVVDVPVGYTHNIENLGSTDMVTLIWVNEIFIPEVPDTYYLEV